MELITGGMKFISDSRIKHDAGSFEYPQHMFG